MQPQLLLIKVLSASKPEDIFSFRNYQQEYLDMVKVLHPDVCQLAQAGKAVAKLNEYRQQMDKYFKGEDEAGSFRLAGENEIHFQGDAALLSQSYQRYQMLMGLGDAAANHFKKYLPESMLLAGNELKVICKHRILPLTHITLPHEHVDWILSRLFEFITWLHQTGYCHLGIHPESVFIVPETHGIIFISFYHLTPINQKPDSLAGQYINWYPAIIFQQKQAIPYIDISLAQRLALYVLGDKSGNGIMLKKTENPQLIDFLITPHYHSLQTYEQFRQLLLQLFGKPIFHPLNI